MSLMLEPIAYIHTDFSEKFGIPRQSGLVKELTGKIIFTETYRNPDALRGLEDFSHIWLLWEFSKAIRKDKKQKWTPTVRPPKLGGNIRKGVFSTRSPFRPNPIGLSCVRLESIEFSDTHGAILHVSGIDLLNHTPIYDIKPYLPYADCHPDATNGFTDSISTENLTVEITPELLNQFPEEKQSALINILALDPRPSYQNDPMRIYGFSFAGYEIKFQVHGKVLTVTDIFAKLPI